MGKAQAKTVADDGRRALVEELVGYEHKHQAMFARIDEIKAALRKLATDAGENFQELVAGKGRVNVSAGHDGKFKGTFPVVQEKTYFELSDARRKKLDEDGIIKMTQTYSGPYPGSVSVKLFPGATA